jgi:5-(carboxyamino)imidazole ribonucleotide synthase
MAVLPGASIGLLGGGQLGRMAAMAARSLGYGVVVLDPDPACAAAAVADRVVAAGFDDATAASALAGAVQVVTYEIERISAGAAAAAAALAPLRPSPAVLTMVQDRARQKEWLAAHGLPVGPWRPAATPDEARAAAAALGGPCRVKVRAGGYDGRGQARALTPDAAATALAALGAPSVVERELELAAEISVQVARRPSGEVVLFPPARNWHVEGILARSVIPAELPDHVLARAASAANTLAEAVSLEGLLTIEYFLTTGGELYVNELAPRPHNTFHATELACATSQFEQLVRAVCDLPLGSTELVRPTALVNLLGDLWEDGDPPLPRALALPGVHLYLYGKRPRRGRKVGHLLASARAAADALALAEEAQRRLSER